jgi:hypothetical protein
MTVVAATFNFEDNASLKKLMGLFSPMILAYNWWKFIAGKLKQREIADRRYSSAHKATRRRNRFRVSEGLACWHNGSID